MSIIIIDYGMSNLGSIKRAIEECGSSPIISDNPKDLENATHIILPGVGSFADGMKNLNTLGWTPAIQEYVKKRNISILGICLGMQLLADIGYEGSETLGLGLIPGKVIKLKTIESTERIPHIGWNEVIKKKDNCLLNNIPDKTDFYFVHSYYFKPSNINDVVAITPYCGEFTSIIAHKNIFGVQFHPEKSLTAGFQVLKSFLTCSGDINC